MRNASAVITAEAFRIFTHSFHILHILFTAPLYAEGRKDPEAVSRFLSESLFFYLSSFQTLLKRISPGLRIPGISFSPENIKNTGFFRNFTACFHIFHILFKSAPYHESIKVAEAVSRLLYS